MMLIQTVVLLALATAPEVGTPLLAPSPLPPPPPPAALAPVPLPAPAQLAPPAPPLEEDVPRAAPDLEVSGPAAVESAVVTEEPRRPMFGVQAEAGVPEGIGGALVFRPWYFVRAHLAVVTNTAAPGIGGGITLIPFRFYVTPTATFEAGHLFEGDLTGSISAVVQKANLPQGTFERVSYDYFTGHLGLEFGAPDRFVVALKGGVSRVNASLRSDPKQVSSSTTVDPGEVKLGLTIPSAKLSLLLFF